MDPARWRKIERAFDRALELCRSAAKEEFFNPELYHNLARVHLAFGAVGWDNSDGTLDGSLANDASQGGTAGVYTATIEVDDGEGGTDTYTLTIDVSNIDPVGADNNVNANDGDDLTGTSVAVGVTDADNDTPLTYAVTGGSLPSGITLNADGTLNGSLPNDASQGGAGLVMPYLQVKDADGRWRTVIEDMGIPAGKPKTIVVDVADKFLSASRQVRIVTNLCVYWDEIFLAAPVFQSQRGGPEARLTDLHAGAAELRFRGFSRVVIHPERKQPERFVYAERRAQALGDVLIGRRLVDGAGRAHLHQFALGQHADAVGQGHRLQLVVGDIEDRGAQVLLDAFQLDPQVLQQSLCVPRRTTR